MSIPRRVGRYSVLAQCASGAFRINSLANHEVLGTTVLLKELRPGATLEMRASFDAEAADHVFLPRLSPLVPQVLELSLSGPPYFYVVEYCDLGDLAAAVKRGGVFPQGNVILMLRQIARGMMAAHVCRMHGDITPPHILHQSPTDGSGEPIFKLIGWADQAAPLFVGTIVGTIMFAAPEKVLEDRDLDTRADIFSLGMTAWYLLCGQSPIVDESGDPVTNSRDLIQERIFKDSYEPRLPHDLYPQFRALLARMLEKRKEQRISTWREVTEELYSIINTYEVSWKRMV